MEKHKFVTMMASPYCAMCGQQENRPIHLVGVSE